MAVRSTLMISHLGPIAGLVLIRPTSNRLKCPGHIHLSTVPLPTERGLLFNCHRSRCSLRRTRSGPHVRDAKWRHVPSSRAARQQTRELSVTLSPGHTWLRPLPWNKDSLPTLPSCCLTLHTTCRKMTCSRPSRSEGWRMRRNDCSCQGNPLGMRASKPLPKSLPCLPALAHRWGPQSPQVVTLQGSPHGNPFGTAQAHTKEWCF